MVSYLQNGPWRGTHNAEWPKYLAVGKADWSELAGRELYNHSNDPEENRNVEAEPASAAVVAELSKQLRVGWRGALIPPPPQSSSSPQLKTTDENVQGTSSQLTPWTSPIRGFNSWQAFRYWITEAEVDGVAAAMASRGFVARNYSYLVIDEGWFTFSNNTNTSRFDTSGADVDAFGRWLPSLDRFPSAAAGVGFRPLCERLLVHHGVLCGAKNALLAPFYTTSRRFAKTGSGHRQRNAATKERFAAGVHLIGGVPIRAALEKRPIKGARRGLTAADIANMSSPNGSPPMTFNAKTLPAGDKLGELVEGAAEYFTSVIDLLVREWGVRFIK